MIESNPKNKEPLLVAQTRTQRHRRTKIIATIGPASNSAERIRQLIKTGANVFRLNFSHGSHGEHLETLGRIRSIAAEMNAPIAVLQDLSGPKIRISEINDKFVTIRDGESIALRPSDGSLSSAEIVYVEQLDPTKFLKAGQQVLLADGSIELRAEEATPQGVKARIVKGGRMRSRVGIAFPDSNIDLPATTEKDLQDLSWAIKNQLDYVALSFVQNAKDILMIRESIRQAQGNLRIIAKIERKAALENIYEILDVSDGLMVARGDLGLELPPEQLPFLQKRLLEEANQRGIPVIVATQMLHSMITSVRPTRAEVSDIAAAVMSGADAVMLSEETAIGENPIEAVSYLHRIALEAERSFDGSNDSLRSRETDRATVPDAVAYAACAAAIKVNASAIIACTETGTSARLVAKYRPQQPLYGAASSDITLRRMALYWGVIPISCKPSSTHYDELDTALRAVQQRENLPNGSRAVIIGGLSVRTPGSTNVLEVREMGYL